MSNVADTVIHVKIRTSECLDALQDAIDYALWAIGAAAEGHAKAECPVDTGNLRNSISHEEDDDTTYIGTDVEYAVYVEYNDMAHHNVGKAHFLRDAATLHGAEYRSIAEAAMRAGGFVTIYHRQEKS